MDAGIMSVHTTREVEMCIALAFEAQWSLQGMAQALQCGQLAMCLGRLQPRILGAAIVSMSRAYLASD